MLESWQILTSYTIFGLRLWLDIRHLTDAWLLYRQDFPDDPDYTDPWQDAGDFIVKHGYKTTMQAAVMGAVRDTEQGLREDDFSSFENLSFADEDDELDDGEDSATSRDHDDEAVVLSRAQTLIAMTHKVNAVVMAAWLWELLRAFKVF